MNRYIIEVGVDSNTFDDENDMEDNDDLSGTTPLDEHIYWKKNSLFRFGKLNFSTKMVVVSSTFSAPAEGILHQQPSVKLLVNDEELGTGNLYITENNVVWGGGMLAAGGEAPTISLQYPTISLHAIQREPSPALYMVLNYELRVPGMTVETGGGDANEDDDFDAEDTPITQLRFIPQSENDLQPLYSAMSQGQSLHPDPQDEVENEDPYMDGEDFDEGEEEFEDAEESNMQPEEAAARLRQMRLGNSNGNHHCEDTEEDAEIGE